MPRPTTKVELIEASHSEFAALRCLVDVMPPALLEGTFAFEDRDRNVRDVLEHVHQWHRMWLKWVAENLAGAPAPFLPEPYNWKTYPDLNKRIWEDAQAVPVDEARLRIEASHQAVMERLETFSDDELFERKYFSWTGSTTLGSYTVSATSSHYQWALKKVRKHVKTNGS